MKYMTSNDIVAMAVEVLGPPAIFEFEDRDAFDGLFRRTIEKWKPLSMVELIFVRDVAYLTWTTDRANTLRQEIIHDLVVPELENIYRKAAPTHIPNAAQFASEFFRSEPMAQVALRKRFYRTITYPKAKLAAHLRLLCAKVANLDLVIAANEKQRKRATIWLTKNRDEMRRGEDGPVRLSTFLTTEATTALSGETDDNS